MSVRKQLQKQVQQKAQETVMKLMADERTRPIVAKAMQGYMEGRQAFDKARDEAAENFGLATQANLNEVKGRLRKIEKKLDDVVKVLEQIQSALKTGQSA